MSDYKGTGIVFVRQLLHRLGEVQENAVIDKLNVGDAKIYRTAMPALWYSLEAAVRIYETAAPVIYPDHPQPLMAFGRDLARNNLNGIYKIIMRLTTLPYAMQQSAKLWQVYCEKGCARSEKVPDRNLIYFIVTDYPDLPKGFRVHLCGYIEAVMEYTGAANVSVRENADSVPEKWSWLVAWT